MERITARSGRAGRAWSLLVPLTLVALPLPTTYGEAPESGKAPVAVARFEGVASPGLRITLKGDRSSGRDLHYRWIQTRGPAAVLASPDRAEASLVVPEGDGPLGFLLVVGNASGVDSSPLTVPVEAVGASPRDPSIRADAGDDLVGFVGRQVTLNGIRSEPRGRIGYRWVQAGGPPVALKLESGCYFTFVPTAPGPYQFALVVASGDRISEPDYVSIQVGPSTPEGVAVAPAPTPPRPPASPPSTDELTRLGVRAIEGGPALAPDLARAFGDVAGRMDLYRSYDEAYSELSRRLDALIPGAPDRRAAWVEKLFNPLTLRMIEALRAEGLDLARPGAQSAPLTPGQRKQLSQHFRSMAEGFGRVDDEPGASRRPDGRSGH